MGRSYVKVGLNLQVGNKTTILDRWLCSEIVILANEHWVHFLNVFLKKADPEGLGKKNFKIETQCN
jgi:hypothetical protein